MAQTKGYLPCFSRYSKKDFPIDDIYSQQCYIDKLKNLLSALVTTVSPFDLSRQHGIGKEIQPIRPDSKEGQRLIAKFAFEYQLYRIDYGDTPFRIIFGLSNIERYAYIFAVDTKHQTYKK